MIVKKFISERKLLLLFVLFSINNTYGQNSIEDKQFKDMIGFYNTDSTHHYSSKASSIVLSGPGTFKVAGDVEGDIYTFNVDSYGNRSGLATYKFSFDIPPQTNITPIIRKMIKAGNNFVLVGDAESSQGSGIVVIVIDKSGNFVSGTYILKSDKQYYGNYVYYTSDHNYLVGGYLWDGAPGVNEYRALALKLDPSLKIIWEMDYKVDNDSKRNKITLLSEHYTGDYMLIGEYSQYLESNANMFCINVQDTDGTLTGTNYGYVAGTNFIPTDIIRDNTGYTIAGTIRNSSLEDMYIFSIDSTCFVKSSPKPTALFSRFEGYEECKSFIQFDDRSYVLAGLSTTLSDNGALHASLVWVDDSVKTIKRNIIYGFKCEDYYGLSGNTGAYAIDGPKDTIKAVMMAGWIGNETYLIKPGLGLDLSDEGDSNYYWCNQIKSYFSLNHFTPSRFEIHPNPPHEPISSLHELTATPTEHITRSCNNCLSPCVDSKGVFIPYNWKEGCSCQKMLKKNH